MTEHDPSKRRFIKAATYVAPAIITLSATPATAAAGSGRRDRNSEYPGEKPGTVGDAPANGGDSASGGSSGNVAYSSKKKKRLWYWPF